MLWTTSLCLFVLWLLALLVEWESPWASALPVGIAALLLYRLLSARWR